MDLRRCGFIIVFGMLGWMMLDSALDAQEGTSYRFSVSFTRQQSAEALDGRLLLVLSTDFSAEPRFQINNSVRSQMLFGLDVDAMKPGEPLAFDDTAFGYPVRYLHDVPRGEYFVQEVLHKYETPATCCTWCI